MIFDLSFRVCYDELANPREIAVRIPEGLPLGAVSLKDMCQAYRAASRGKRGFLVYDGSNPILFRLLEELPRS